jgi:hypothetical protein
MVAAALLALLAAAPVRAADPPRPLPSVPPAAEPAGPPAASPAGELDATWATAQSAYRAGDYERTVRLLEGLVASIEGMPPGPAAAGRWTGAMLRLAQAEATLGRTSAARASMERVAALDPGARPDPALYPPSFRGQFEEARRAVAGRARHRLTVTSPEPGGTAWVHGRPVGSLPATVELPAGRYRVTVTWSERGDAGEWVELAGDRTRDLAPPPARPPPAPSPPALAALAPIAPEPLPASAVAADLPASRSGSWMGPSAIATGGVALAGAGVAIWQGIAAGQAQKDAQAMVRPDGSLVPGANPDDYAAAVARYDAARTNALVAGGIAVAMTAASVVLWVLLDEPPAAGGPAIRF